VITALCVMLWWLTGAIPGLLFLFVHERRLARRYGTGPDPLTRGDWLCGVLMGIFGPMALTAACAIGAAVLICDFCDWTEESPSMRKPLFPRRTNS
jgi:hypothetical protein